MTSIVRGWLLLALLPAAALAKPAEGQPRPPPTDEQCKALPPLRTPVAFRPGESLEFDVDALGATAGKMTMRVLPSRDGLLPVEARAQTNPFFGKVRRVNGVGTSYLNAKTLRPTRYYEDSVENEVRRTAEVTFRPKEKKAKLEFTIGEKSAQTFLGYANDGLDVVGAIYLMRQLPYAEGLKVCFDVYGIRKMWRLEGKVEAREHVSLPVGEFEAWHLSGTAVRVDDHRQRREVHVWISDDERRLPLAAIGAIDLGAVRATLVGFSRPGDKRAKAQGKESLKW